MSRLLRLFAVATIGVLCGVVVYLINQAIYADTPLVFVALGVGFALGAIVFLMLFLFSKKS